MNPKIFLLLLSVYFSGTLIGQVHVSAKAKRETSNQYHLSLTVSLDKGSHFYAFNPEQNIEGPVVRFINAKVLPAEFFGQPLKMDDPVFENKKVNAYTNAFELSAHITIEGNVPATLKGVLSGFAAKGDEFNSVQENFSVNLEGGTETKSNSLKINSIDADHPLHEGVNDTQDHSALGVFFLGLLGGLLALLTPCVFPMIPVTVSFFTSKANTKKQGIRNGILYGLFILLIYLCASIPFHLIKGMRPELLNNIATSAPLNIFFFVVFLIFAVSFFGAFELTLPSSVATRAGKKSGIFFMALTLCIVSFSCTGPILGSLLVGSLSGGAWLLTAGLAGFGIALALPFALFAIFPSALARIPKSGEWMITVKKVLAFVELALAFKFLSNADLVMHWGILKREVFIGIWILIGVMLAAYLVDLPWFVHYGRLRITKAKAVLSVLVLVFVAYLCTGLNGGQLSLLSGFPPPHSYSVYPPTKKTLEADIVNDYDQALSLAKTQNKKLLIDFTGWACVNCRKMEEHIWTDPAVAAYIKENFILVSLYVDDKKMLPVEMRNDSLQTVGDKWAKFQVLNVKQATQPLYAVLNTEQQLMTKPQGYQPDAEKFLLWLKKGVTK